MSAVAQITIGTSTYDVYGTEAEVKTYLSGRLGTDDYDNASSTDRKKAHVQATRWVDRERWNGQPTDLVTPQPLQYPRTGLVDCNGNIVDSATVPQEVCNAVGELILILLGDATATSSGSTSTNNKLLKAGSVEIEFFKPGDTTGGSGTVLPTEAWKWVSCFAGSGSPSIPFVSGTDVESQFDDCDTPELWRGYP